MLKSIAFALALSCVATAGYGYDGVTPEAVAEFEAYRVLVQAINACPGLVWNDGASVKASRNIYDLAQRNPALDTKTPTKRVTFDAAQCQHVADANPQWVHIRTADELAKIAADEAAAKLAAEKEAAIARAHARRIEAEAEAKRQAVWRTSSIRMQSSSAAQGRAVGRKERIRRKEVVAAGVKPEYVEDILRVCVIATDLTTCAKKWDASRRSAQAEVDNARAVAAEVASHAKPVDKEFNADEVAATLARNKAKRLADQESVRLGERKLEPFGIENFLKDLQGEDVSPVTKLSQSEDDAFRGQVQRCWNIPAGALDGAALKVTMQFDLDQAGALIGSPKVVSKIGKSGVERAAAEAARRAVSRCSPYNLPPEKYDAWRHVTVNFDPSEMF